jgi:hypothetical protein
MTTESSRDEAALRALIENELERMEDGQRKKVLELARRIHPGLTAEDIRNPHDFPDLDDPDWHFEDGVLTGIQSVQVVLRALFRSQNAK